MPPIERYAQGIGNPNLDLMKAWQMSIGGEGELGYGIQIDTSVFTGYMTDMIEIWKWTPIIAENVFHQNFNPIIWV